MFTSNVWIFFQAKIKILIKTLMIMRFRLGISLVKSYIG